MVYLRSSEVRRGHEIPRPGVIDGCEQNPGHLRKQQLPLTAQSSLQTICIFKIQFFNIFMNTKSQIIQEFHCKTSWAPFSDHKHLSAPFMTTAWEPLDLPLPLRAAMSEIITFEDQPLRQRRTSSVFYWSSPYCLETGPLPVWIGLGLGSLPVSTPNAGVT